MALIGSGTEQDPYLIGTVSELQQMTNGTSTAKKYYKMVNDIELPNRSSSFPLSGKSHIIFDGDGYKFTKLNYYESQYNSSSYENWGVWDTLANSTIKNVGADSFIFNTYAKTGAFTGTTSGTCIFENCYVTKSIIRAYATGGVDYWKHFGGFVGVNNGTLNFIDCFYNGLYRETTPMSIDATSYAGGFVGNGKANFTNCYFIGSVYTSKASNGGSFVYTGSKASSTFNNVYEVNLGTQEKQATVLTREEMKNPSLLGDTWGIHPDYNFGFPMPKVFLPQEVPAVIEQRNVEFYIDPISMTAESRIISPSIQTVSVDFDVAPIDINVDASVKLYIPSIQRVEVEFSTQPISMSAYTNLIQIIRKHIEVLFSIDPIKVESKRTQFKKTINDILIHMNEITVDTKTVADLAPTQFKHVVNLLENRNDVTLIHYLLNEVYVKENTNDVKVINNNNLINHMTNRNEVRILTYTGDTVTLQAKFRTHEGYQIDPTDVKLKIYKTTLTSNVLIETISLTENDKTFMGEYTYGYVVPTDLNTKETDTLVYEFSGMYEGKPTLIRGILKVRFV